MALSLPLDVLHFALPSCCDFWPQLICFRSWPIPTGSRPGHSAQLGSTGLPWMFRRCRPASLLLSQATLDLGTEQQHAFLPSCVSLGFGREAEWAAGRQPHVQPHPVCQLPPTADLLGRVGEHRHLVGEVLLAFQGDLPGAWGSQNSESLLLISWRLESLGPLSGSRESVLGGRRQAASFPLGLLLHAP